MVLVTGRHNHNASSKMHSLLDNNAAHSNVQDSSSSNNGRKDSLLLINSVAWVDQFRYISSSGINVLIKQIQ